MQKSLLCSKMKQERNAQPLSSYQACHLIGLLTEPATLTISFEVTLLLDDEAQDVYRRVLQESRKTAKLDFWVYFKHCFSLVSDSKNNK